MTKAKSWEVTDDFWKRASLGVFQAGVIAKRLFDAKEREDTKIIFSLNNESKIWE